MTDAVCHTGDMHCFVSCWHDQRLHDIMRLDLRSVTWTCFVMQLQAALMLVNDLFPAHTKVLSMLTGAVLSPAWFCNLNWMWRHVMQACSKSWHHILEQPTCMWRSHHPGLLVLGQAEIMKRSQINHFVGTAVLACTWGLRFMHWIAFVLYDMSR